MSDVVNCLCQPDEDGILETVCDHHRLDYLGFERRVRDMLDYELDVYMAATFGKRKDLARIVGTVARFDVKR